MTHEQLIQLLIDAGYTSGWAISEQILTVWEHDENPPDPLVRPGII
jgi:hypothetical protein